MAIYLPRKWRYQPQCPVEIDQRNPLAQGLIWFGYPPYGDFFDGRFRPSTLDMVTKFGPSVTPIGQGIYQRDLTNSGGVIINEVAQRVNRLSGAVACGWIIRTSDISSSARYLFCLRQNATSGDRLFIYRYSVSTYRIQVNALASVDSGIAWPLDTYGVAAADLLASSVNGYFQGKLAAQVPAALATAPGYGRVGYPPASTSAWGEGGDYHWAAVWDRPLGADGHRALAENPWQLFRAPDHKIWFDLGAGGGGSTVYTLNAGAVSLSTTDADAAAMAQRRLDAQVTSASLAAETAALAKLSQVDAQPMALGLSAATAEGKVTRRLSADPITTILTGVVASSYANRLLSADSTSVSIMAAVANFYLPGHTRLDAAATTAAIVVSGAELAVSRLGRSVRSSGGGGGGGGSVWRGIEEELLEETPTAEAGAEAGAVDASPVKAALATRIVKAEHPLAEQLDEAARQYLAQQADLRRRRRQRRIRILLLS